MTWISAAPLWPHREARKEATLGVLLRNFSHAMKIHVCHSHEGLHFQRTLYFHVENDVFVS